MNTIHLASILAATAILSGPAMSQHSLLFSVRATQEYTLENGNGLAKAGELIDDEVAVVTPLPIAYSARTYIGVSNQWAWRGDDDQDERIVDSSTDAPGGPIDAVMVKRFPAPSGNVHPREVCLSTENDYSTTFGYLDGDVFYYASQGVVKHFITEALLESVTGGTTLDVNAICQDYNGDLYVSFDSTETINGASRDDGDIIRIPASLLTFDANGDVTAVVPAPNTVELVATQSELQTMAANSGVADYNGGPASTSLFDVCALDLDPNGGTFTSASGTFPNLLFNWASSSSECAIISTASGGSIATINTVAMGSTTATTGIHMGLLPGASGTDSLNGLAVIPIEEDYLTCEVTPTVLITSSTTHYTRPEISNATPGGAVGILVGIGPVTNGMPGAQFDATAVPGLFVDEFFQLSFHFVLATVVADAQGYASFEFVFPGVLNGSGLAVTWQGFDFGRLQFSTPGAVQFLYSGP